MIILWLLWRDDVLIPYIVISPTFSSSLFYTSFSTISFPLLLHNLSHPFIHYSPSPLLSPHYFPQVKYFKEMGMWFLPDRDMTCEDSKSILAYSTSGVDARTRGWSSAWSGSADSNARLRERSRRGPQGPEPGAGPGKGGDIMARCCQRGGYWANMPQSAT